jgi:hypothetical protein
MSNYFDKWGRLHHKPCRNHNPSSNNGWIYSAYFYKAGGSLEFDKLRVCFGGCFRDGAFHRHPPSIESKVPNSRDEILGAASLGLLKSAHLNGWSFSPFPIPRFNLKTLIKQIKELKGQHRNYFWQNKLDQIYRFAFSVPLQDRAFLLECWGETKSLRYFFYKGIALLDAKFAKPKNGIHWLKYGGEERKRIMQAEFPEDHPLRSL